MNGVTGRMAINEGWVVGTNYAVCGKDKLCVPKPKSDVPIMVAHEELSE